MKLRSEINSDYCNLENTSFLYSSRNSVRSATISSVQLPVVSDPQSDNEVPPTPPPKPPKNKAQSVIL